MEEFNQLRALRRTYPVALSAKHREELLQAFPASPKDEALASLAISYDNVFLHISEIDLAIAYHGKRLAAQAQASEVVFRETGEADMALSLGLFLGNAVQQAYETTTGLKRTPTVAQREQWATLVFSAWKNSVSPALWRFQATGVQRFIDIHQRIFGVDAVTKVVSKLLAEV